MRIKFIHSTKSVVEMIQLYSTIEILSHPT